MKHISREDVIRQIVHRDVERLGLTSEVVRRHDAALYQSACDHFGTWETALRYAGVNTRGSHTLESRDRVTQRLRKYCALGHNLTTTHNQRNNRKLYNIACEHFGSWKKALQAGGVNLEHAFLKSPRRHDRRQILDAILARRASGLSITWSDTCLDNRELATAAKHTFGSWRRALIAAGIEPESHVGAGRQNWDQQRVIDSICRRREEGKSLRARDVERDDSSLRDAARRYFGNWGNAIRAAGVAGK